MSKYISILWIDVTAKKVKTEKNDVIHAENDVKVNKVKTAEIDAIFFWKKYFRTIENDVWTDKTM